MTAMKKSSYKTVLKKIPGVGHGARTVKHVIKRAARDDRIDLLADRQASVEQTTYQNGVDIRSLSIRIDKLNEHLETLMYNQDDIRKQLSEIKKSPKPRTRQLQASRSTPTNSVELFANNHLLDVFYTRFEDRFKDTKETKRLYKQYKDQFLKSKVDFKKYPVLDIGCGRGEFLEYMKEIGINAIGVDINTDMVERANKRGFSVAQGDAETYLEGVPVRSLGAITGFHLVEHIPFQNLLGIFTAAHTALVPGGFVLFETPNPENILVATNSFYFDPSHLKPIPPGLLAFALEVCGFKDIEIIRSYPVPAKNKDSVDSEVLKHFYGPRNYAVIGYK